MVISTRGLLILAGFLFGLLLIFQLFNLTTTSLWHDEAFSGLLIQYEDYGEMMRRIGLDVHPPLYYMLLRGWAEISNASLLSMRFFSLLFGLATIYGTFLLAKQIFRNTNLAVLSATLLGLSSFQIQYHLEARMYTLAAFLLVFATLFLLRALQTETSFLPLVLWLLAYILFATAALYTHYYTVFGISAHGLFVLYTLRLELKKLILFIFGFSAILLLYIPWFPTFLRQLAQVQESYWIPPVTKWSAFTTISKMVTGDGFDPSRVAFLIILINILIGVAFGWMLFRYPQREKWVLPLLFFIPLAGSLLLSLKTSIYLDRYFIFYLPFLIITISAAVFAIPQKRVRTAMLALLLLGAALSYPVHWKIWGLGDKPGMAGASAHLLHSAQNQDIILINSSFVYFTFRYYNTSALKPLLYTPSELAHFSGTALLNKEDMVRSFENAAHAGDTVWTIDTTGFGNFQPTPPDSWQKLQEQEFPDAYDHRGLIIVRKYVVQN